MISLHQITLQRGSRVLFDHADFTIFAQQRIGLIGHNGSGKSSLFALLLQQLDVDEGSVSIPAQLVFSHLAQEIPALEQSALDYVLDGDKALRQNQHELRSAEHNDDGMRIAEIHHALEAIDAYSAPARAAELLDGLGFTHAQQQQSVASFSGGWRVRLNLAQALMCPSDVLLLDEPTNHLDLDALLWLEQWLKQYRGTLLIISHDRDFLDATVDHIAFIHDQKIHCYSGNYSAFETLRAAELLMQQKLYEKQKKKIAHMQKFVERFRYKATKARQAQSRLKAISRLELVSAVQSQTPFQFEFFAPKQLSYPLLEAEDIVLGYDDKVVLHQLHFSLRPNDRIGLIGPNGAGKSTFIQFLAGQLTAQHGHYSHAPGLGVGYFAQHQIDVLRLNETPLQHLQSIAPQETDFVLRQYLGRFGFSNDQVFEPLRNFSGGEKSRLALALLVWQRPSVLLLDEPTNHLDLEMRQALVLALQEFEGALVLISHDRFLIRSCCDQLLLIANQRIQNFDGDLEDYQRWLFDYRKEQKRGLSSVEIKQEAMKSTLSYSDKRALNAKLKRLESQLHVLQNQAASLEARLSEQHLYDEANHAALQALLAEFTQVREKIDQVESAWLIASEENEK